MGLGMGRAMLAMSLFDKGKKAYAALDEVGPGRLARARSCERKSTSRSRPSV